MPIARVKLKYTTTKKNQTAITRLPKGARASPAK